MLFFKIIFAVSTGIIAFQLLLPFFTTLAAQIGGRERLTPRAATPVPDHACIITAYKNADIAKPLVQSLLRQDYTQYQIYLVADECPDDFDPGIVHPQLTVLRTNPPLRLKVKSILYATESFVRPHTHIGIFDADNLVHPNFLSEINSYIAAGHRCIQGQRTAKNVDNNFAAADSLGELYKNHIERYAPYLLGGSAVISGSGMVTESALYHSYLQSKDIQQGQHLGKKMLQEDKILQNVLLRNNEQIMYARKAICYDEKVQNAEAVQTQRSRWLFSYFQNIPNTLLILWRGISRGSWNQFYFGLITLSLPMFLQLGAAFLLFLAGWFILPAASILLAGAVLVFCLNICWILHLDGAPGAVWRAIGTLPAFAGRQFAGLLKMGNPNKNFKHTEHTQYISVEDILKKEGE